MQNDENFFDLSLSRTGVIPMTIWKPTMRVHTTRLFAVFFIFISSGCTYNPFIGNNETTGNVLGAGLGAAGGAGIVSAIGGTKPMIALGGIGGGMFGYYMTTLRHDSGGIIKGGGQVYKVGNFIGIYIPSDSLFEPNTAELLPMSVPILDSVVTVLNRYPNNNIIISGNTSGFYRSRWEQNLSEKRAKVISAYLWREGINEFKTKTNDFRKLNYVGHGDFFPIAHDLNNDGIRANSRIQITSYPKDCDLGLDKQSMAMHNISSDDINLDAYPVNHCADGSRLNDGSGECETTR